MQRKSGFFCGFILLSIFGIPSGLLAQTRGTTLTAKDKTQRSVAFHGTDMKKRLALVIGNAAYHSGELKNALNDAEAMRDVLMENGFTVIYKKNLLAEGIDSAISQFGNAIVKDTGVHLFYYSGHGIQYNGENYLLSTDAVLTKSEDIKTAGARLNRVFTKLSEATGGYNLVLMDACRSIPFAEKNNLSQGLRDIDDAPINTSVFFATKPNHVAYDGSGDHSPFTEALIKHIKEDSLEFYEIARRVTRDVVQNTQSQQYPTTMGMALESFYFKQVKHKKPRLHLLSIGVSAYDDLSAHPLMYGSESARDFGNMIQEIIKNDSIYSGVNTVMLLNGGATRYEILKSLKMLKDTIKEGDVLLFYFSGYLMTEFSESYFLPADGSPDRVSIDGIPSNLLFSVLTSLPCKSMLLLDKAGPMSNNALYDEIKTLNDPANNVVVLASSHNNQVDLEGIQWGSSLFLYGIKESISQQLAESGSINVETLCHETTQRVYKESEGRQIPQAFMPKGYLNFELFRSGTRFERDKTRETLDEFNNTK